MFKTSFKKIVKILQVVLLVLLCFYIGFTLSAPKRTAKILGFKPYAILSNSMKPVFERGDLIVIGKSKPEQLKVGDIIAFENNNGIEVVHRLVEINEDFSKYYFKTKADANDYRDYWTISGNQVYGKHLFTLKYLGHIFLFLRSKYGIVSIIVSVICILIIKKYSKED